MMPGSSDLTKTSDRVFSHSTSPHWSTAKRSSPIKSYRRRTVCLFPDPSSLLPCQTRRRRNRLLLICHHIIDCDKGGEYPRPWFATASDLLWYAACYEHPYSSPYPQCDSGFVCCQTVCLTVARPSVVESALRKRPMTEPPFICLFPDRLLVCCQTLGVCCKTRRWRSQPFVCRCYLSNWSRKGRLISVPKVCDCLGLALVCCMSWTPIPITVATVWQWIMPRPHVKIKHVSKASCC